MTFDEFLTEWKNDKDFISVKTSGSTGEPKEMKLQKEFVRESALRTNKFFKLDCWCRFHSCVAADFIGGKMMAVRADIAGARFTYETPSNNALKDIDAKDCIHLLAVVPSQMISILERIDRLPEIRNIIIGGSSISPGLKRKIAESGLNAYETYGMTETASHIALRQITKEDAPFQLLPDIQIYLAEDSCLCIKFKDGREIFTNDMAELVSESEFYIKGRKDNVIISGGKKIHPSELENKLCDVIDSAFYFKSEPDEKWGEKLVLMIEGNPADIDTDNLRLRLSTLLLRWEHPKEIIFVPQFERTPNGKIIRK